MGFIIGSIDQKQHLNLSNQAWITINNDIDMFLISKNNSYNLSGFLNTIFENFYEDAKASISLRLEIKRDYYEILFSDEGFTNYDNKIKNDFIDKILTSYQESLFEEINNYPKGEGKKFRVNNTNNDILEESQEDKYYNGNVGSYLKGIFEEYANKPFYEREQIFFKKLIEVIKEAILRKNKIKITLENDKKFLVSPFSIITDKTSLFNYLIGFSHEIKDSQDNTKDTLSTYRVARIKKIQILKTKKYKITDSDKKFIESEISTKGLQFLSVEDTEIVVKLTNKGVEKYKSQLHLRPQYTEIKDNNIYVFHCTELQILYYFFKFGKDATIISPQSLRNQFIRYYQSALNSYTN